MPTVYSSLSFLALRMLVEIECGRTVPELLVGIHVVLYYVSEVNSRHNEAVFVQWLVDA